MIETDLLVKKFKIYKKHPGFLGAVKSLFYREYETNEAVKKFNLSVQPGEMIGLLGPNGAGKTTLMKMFTGIIVPSSGKLRVHDHEPSKREKEFLKRIALVMGQKSQLWWDLPAMDSFQLLQRFYEVSDRDFEERVKLLSEMLNVQKILQIHVRKLSLGERMKVELMAALLHNPDILFLDEPTIGLDVIAQDNIRRFIEDYHRKTNCTVVLTSHYMADVEALCSRLVLLLEGTKRFDGPIEEFTALLGPEKQVAFTFEKPVNPKEEFWIKYDAQWIEEGLRVELKMPETELRELSAYVLTHYPVSEFQTEKLPVERVMKTLLNNPNLLKEPQ